jgi:hypothetical protein
MTCKDVCRMLAVVLFFIFHCANFARSAVIDEEGVVKFSIATTGGVDGSINNYGSNGISVSEDGVLLVGMGDTDHSNNINGVGLYEMRLSGESAEVARKLAHLLCSEKDPNSDVPVNDRYIVKCDNGDGGLRYGGLRDFGRDTAIQIAHLVDSLKAVGMQSGRPIVKLDVSLLGIKRERAGFVVSVRFLNGGDYPIAFKTPDKWDEGVRGDILAVSGRGFGIALAGHPIANKNDFPGGEVNIEPRSSITLDIVSDDVEKFYAGSYKLSVNVFMNMRVIGRDANLARADFHSDYKDPTPVTFDRDYPSTPQEREQWEAKHRADMSFRPVKPGETFAEDGLYRAVRVISGGTYRSLQVLPFKTGDVATTDAVKMPMESGNGVNINGPVQWVWEGSAPQPVKPFATEYVDGTQHHCAPGAGCPRGGRWVARTLSGWNALYPQYRYDLSRIVTLQRGQTMPSIQNAADKAEWEWVGA